MLQQTQQESKPDVSMESPFPFGKYKGAPLAVVIADGNYMQWLEQQAWMGDKYPNIVEYFRNGPAKEDSCTPDHNAMQLRYLDKDYCNKLVKTMAWKSECRKEYHEVDGSHFGSSLYIDYGGGDHTHECILAAPDQDKYRVYENYRVDHAESPVRCASPSSAVCSTMEFESRNWDVAIYIQEACSTGHRGSSLFTLLVELKPSISEDYPAILRKVKARKYATDKGEEYSRYRTYVVADQYTGKSATLEQVKKMFAASNITFLLSSEFS